MLRATRSSHLHLSATEPKGQRRPGKTRTGSQRSVLLNSIALLFGRILTVFASFVTVPFAVRALGMPGYGTWETLYATSLVANMFQSAISATLVWKMSSSHGSEGNREVRRLIRVGFWAVLCLATLLLPAIWLARHRIIAWMNIPAEFVSDSQRILPLLSFILIIAGFNEVFAAAITASQRVGLANVLQSAGIVLNNLVVILALRAGCGLSSLIAGQAVGFLFTFLALYIASSIIYGPLALLPTRPTRLDVRAMSPYLAILLVGSVSLVLRDQTDKLILATLKNPAWVGYFGIAARLASPVLLICGFFYVPLFSAVAALHAQNERAQIITLFDMTATTVALFAGCLMVLIASLHDRIVLFWIGRPLPQVTLMLYLLLGANLTAALLTGAGSALCKGVGRPGIEAIYVVVSLALNVALKLILVNSIGAIGTVLASTVSWVAGSMVFVVVLHRALPVPINVTLRSASSLLAAVAAVAATRALFSPADTGRPASALMLQSLFIGVVAILIFVILFAAIQGPHFLHCHDPAKRNQKPTWAPI